VTIRRQSSAPAGGPTNVSFPGAVASASEAVS
jgi:hypothetical protein